MKSNRITQAEIDALRAIESADGEITPEQVVEAASDIASPLHHRFTWDDSDAAQSWREQEAREFIRVVRIEIKTETTTISAPLYVHDPTAAGQSYRNTKTLMESDPDRAKAVLAYTVSVARGHLTRAQELAAVFGLDGQIGGLIKQMTEIEDRLSDEASVGANAAL